ncbi:MAG: DUF748 domain-containing protein [Pseudomonadota bacterium]|nr:DUF748 domain-containing protein [Pseudomonadota bacterium]
MSTSSLLPSSPLRRGLLIAGGVLLALAVALLLFVRFALPGLIQKQASRYVLQQTGHHLALDVPEIRLFGPQVVLRHVRLDEPDGKPLLSFERFELRLAVAPLLHGEVQLDVLALDRPHATVVVRRDGRLNWSTLIERLQPKTTEAPRPGGTPTPVRLQTLTVAAAEIDAADERSGFGIRTAPLDLALSGLSTTGDASGHYRMSATTSLGASIAIEGDAVVKTLHTEGSLRIEGLQLATLAPLVDAQAPIRLPAGTASVQTHYRFAYPAGRPELLLDGLRAEVRDLAVHQAAEPGPALQVAAIRLEQGRFDLAPRQASLAGLTITGSRLTLPRAGAAPVEVGLGSVAVTQLTADLGARELHVGKLSLEQGRLQATRLRDGRIDVLEAVHALQGAGTDASAGTAPPPKAGSAGAAPVSAPAAAQNKSPAQSPWRYALDELALQDFSLTLRDQAVQPEAALELQAIGLAAHGLSQDLNRAVPVKAAFKVRSGGSFDAQGTVVPGTASADLGFHLVALALQPAQPYLSQFARLRLDSGEFSTGGRIQVGGSGGPQFRGDFKLARLRLLETDGGKLFLGMDSFGTRKLSASPKRLDIPQLVLVGLDAQLLIAKDHSVNLSRILVKPAAGGATAPAAREAAGTPATRRSQTKGSHATAGGGTAPAPPRNLTGEFQANIDQLRISRSALDFADESLALPFGTHIHDLHGVLNGLSTRSDARGQIQLDGQVDDYGTAHADGRLDLFNPTAFMDLKVVFRNVEMTRLTPYSATFAGRRITSGKLSLDLQYRIKDRQLEGENQVVMDRLTLGERVDSPGATALPLDLAIAILEDADGRIDLGLPVSGSLDDPQFSYGRLVWKAIVNVIGKIALAPFRALGALFGGAGDKFESVLFAPGSGQLAAPEREKLLSIAGALAKRPGIAMRAPAPWSEADRSALQDLALRRALATRAGQPPAADEDPGPVATRSPEVQTAIEAEFSARLGAATLAPLRQAAQTADGSTPGDAYFDELIARLRAAVVIADPALQALALQRATAVVNGLQTAGVPAARLSTGEALKVELTDGNVALKLQPGAAVRAAP